MGNMGSKGIIRYLETFTADNIATGTATAAGAAGDGIAWICTMDSGDTGFVRAVNASRGLHVTAATDTTDNDMLEFASDNLRFYGQTGMNAVEILAQFDVVTGIAFNFGFNDACADTTGLPIELSGTTWTTNASSALMLVYDIDATNDELHCMWVDDDTDATNAIATLRMNGVAPTASQWLWMRVEMQDRGSGYGVAATFTAVDHNGRSCTKEFNTTLDRDVALCYYFGIENRAASAVNCYIKAVAWEQTIA